MRRTGRNAAPASSQPISDEASSATGSAMANSTSSRVRASRVSLSVAPTTRYTRAPRTVAGTSSNRAVSRPGGRRSVSHGRSCRSSVRPSSGSRVTERVAARIRPSPANTWANDSSLSARCPLVCGRPRTRLPPAISAWARARSPMSTSDRRSLRTWTYTKLATASETSVMPTANASVSRALSDIRLTPIGADPIADAPHRHQVLTAERPVDLVAQAADVDVDDVGVTAVACLPYGFDQPLPRQHRTAVAHQELEQGELLGCQLDRRPSPGDRMGGRIEAQGAGRQHGRPLDRSAPHQRPQAREQLGELE